LAVNLVSHQKGVKPLFAKNRADLPLERQKQENGAPQGQRTEQRRRLEPQRRHRAAALQNLAEIVTLWNTRQRRGVRQPYAALTSVNLRALNLPVTPLILGKIRNDRFQSLYTYCLHSVV
jgi:hypothetical protein